MIKALISESSKDDKNEHTSTDTVPFMQWVPKVVVTYIFLR